MQQRNYTIDLLRLLFAVLVVGLHTVPFQDRLALIAKWVNVSAVPFFCTVSGYNFCKSYKRARENQRPYLCSYVKNCVWTYLKWTTFMYSTVIYNQLKWEKTLYLSWEYWLESLSNPSHLWFLLAMAVLAVLYAVLENHGLYRLFCAYGAIAYVLYRFSCSFYQITPTFLRSAVQFVARDDIYLVFAVFFWAAPFFVMGTALAKKEEKVVQLPKRIVDFSLIAAIALYGIECLVILKLHLARLDLSVWMPFYPILALIVFAIKNPNFFSASETQARYCRSVSAFTYYIHPFFIFAITQFSLFDLCSSTDRFVIVSVISLTLGTVIHLIRNEKN